MQYPDIDEQYHNCFDFILFTIGAITWFEDLQPLFSKVSDCLKPGGTLLIHDFHPIVNMLPMPGEPEFDENHLNRIVYSYFRSEPWIENEGMDICPSSILQRPLPAFSHNVRHHQCHQPLTDEDCHS